MVNDFYTKYKTEIEEIAKNTRKQLLEENIPFWENRILDVEYGGYFNTFNKKGERVDDVKVGWFVGRDMYTFSALYRKIQPQKKWLDIAKQGYDFLETSFYAGEGRFNKLLSRKGEVLEGTTSIFTDFFAVKGLFEYLKAIENPSEEQLEKAKFLADKLFENIKKDEILSREGIKPGWQKHAINFMTLYEKFATEELKPFMEQLNNSKAEPSYERWSEMEPIIFQYMQNAVSGSMSVDEACEAMTKDIDVLLAN